MLRLRIQFASYIIEPSTDHWISDPTCPVAACANQHDIHEAQDLERHPIQARKLALKLAEAGSTLTRAQLGGSWRGDGWCLHEAGVDASVGVDH